MTTPERGENRDLVGDRKSLIMVVRKIFKKLGGSSASQEQDQWPTTTKQSEGSGNSELDQRLTDIFDDSLF